MPISRPRRAAALAAAVAMFALAPRAHAQTFARVTDVQNPIFLDAGPSGNYSGASWIDYDGDGLPDLFVNKMGFYHNKGGGKFEKIASVQAPAKLTDLGNSWADYDNDGDPDLLITGSGNPSNFMSGTLLFRNDGGPGSAAGPFTRVLTGAMADSMGNGGWSCAWGDYDVDGRMDAVVAGIPGFNAAGTNPLLHNLGGDLFERDTTTQVDDFTAPFTIATWSDFDQDGDPDLFIGSGPANGTLGPDYCFRNSTFGPAGTTRLDRMLGDPFSTTRDGQMWNWVDYDDDGDLDAFITNYGTPLGSFNEMWRNDGGTYVPLTAANLGTILSDKFSSLSSCWTDFDDDGDLDCLVTQDNGAKNTFYRNDVDSLGSFTAVSLGTTAGTVTGDAGPHGAAVTADYDLDGFEDLYVNGPGLKKALYHNTTHNGCHWVEFRLVGNPSNRSAIGARIHVRAMIKGQPRWQMREIVAQNAFNGQSDLVAHFGLREAQRIDSIRIEWPSGRVETAGGAAVDRIYTVPEGSLGATPTRLALAEVRVTERGTVRLAFAGALDPGTIATVERSDDGAAWSALGTLGAATGDVWIFEDATVEAGRRYAYRAAFHDAHGAAAGVTDAAWVDVPAGAVAFGFRALPANPAALGAALRFGFALAPGDDARFELVGANGRVAWARALPASAHAVDVPGNAVAPGIYWARVSQGARQEVRKVVLLR